MGSGIDYHLYFFFFKQKTAYDVRISDWSSDVCSSDRAERWHALLRRQIGLGVGIKRKMLGLERVDGAQWRQLGHAPGVLMLDAVLRRECLHQRRAPGGAAVDNALDRRTLGDGARQVLQQPTPQGRHHRRERDGLVL